MKFNLRRGGGRYAALMLILAGCSESQQDAVEHDVTTQEDAERIETEVATPPSATCIEMTEACTAEPARACGTLFGRPSQLTGLAPDSCLPQCSCGSEVWSPPPIDPSYTDALLAMTLVNEPELLDSDPYADPLNAELAHPEMISVCGLHRLEQGRYELVDYPSADAALEAGAYITHYGSCGACSSLRDLAVYINYPDLTEPVRECGIVGIIQGDEAQSTCIQDLGFSPACAQIWSFNTSNTRTHCQSICIALIDAPYHQDDGSPNACIQCDEDISGPVFKTYAGRTRRNSGLPTALCRPCSEVKPVVHDYASTPRP